MSWLRLALANLSLSPLTSAVNVLLMGLGTASIVLLLLVGTQLSNTMSRDAQGIDLVLGAKGSPVQLVLSTVYHADAPPGNISLAVAESWAADRRVANAVPMSLGDSYQEFRIVGTTPDYADFYSGEVRAGDWWDDSLEAVIGANVAAATGLEVGATFASAHGFADGGHAHETEPYRVVGVLAPTGSVLDRLILTSLESVWDIHGDGRHAHEHADEDEHHDKDGDDEHHEEDDHDERHEEEGHDDHAGAEEPHDEADHHDDEAYDEEHHDDADHHDLQAGHDDDHAEDDHDDHAGNGGHHDDHDEHHDEADQDDHDHDEHHGEDDHDDRDSHEHDDDEAHGEDDDHDHAAHEDDEHEHGRDKSLEITAMLLRYRTPTAAASLPRQINLGQDLQAAAPAVEVARVLQLVGVGLDGLRTFAWLLVISAGLSIFAALYGSLRSRRGDIAMMRCLGATRWELLYALILEGVVLTALGIALGLLLGHVSVELLGNWLESARGVSFTGLMWPAAETGLILGLFGVGVIAAAIPAIQAYRTDVARTLAEAP